LKNKIIVLIGVFVFALIPLAVYSVFFQPYSPGFRYSEVISDSINYYIKISDDSGKAFMGFEENITASVTLRSLYLGEVEILIPISNVSEIASRNLTISSNNNQTLRPFIKYPYTITYFSLQQGGGNASITMPADLNSSAILGVRQQIILAFSTKDSVHWIQFRLMTEGKQFGVTERLFLCSELQFVGVPESNPFYLNMEFSDFGVEIAMFGITTEVNYRLGLSDSFRELVHFSTNLNWAVFALVTSISLSLASVFVSVCSYFAQNEPMEQNSGMIPNDNKTPSIVWKSHMESGQSRAKRMSQSADDFLIVDFEQQYSEYRNAENSRLRYVEFYMALIGAFLGFYGVFLQRNGLALQSPEMAIFFALLFTVFFEIGRRLIESMSSTRIAQLKTAVYIGRIREYFAKNQNMQVLKDAEVAIGRNWWDVRSHAIRLILLIVFLNNVALAVALFQWLHLLLPLLWTASQQPFLGFTYEAIASAAMALIALALGYFLAKRKLEHEIETAEDNVGDGAKRPESTKNESA